MKTNVTSLESVVGKDADVLRERPFQLLLLTNMLPALGVALLSPVLESLIEPFGTSAANIGLIMSAFTASAAVLIPVAGVLADRYGRRPVILFGLLCFGASGTAIAFTTEFWIALVLRLLQGAGFAALIPIIITSIGDLYTSPKEATAQGLRFTSSGITQTFFPLAAGVLVGISWQYPFLLYAIAFPVAAMVYVWLEEPVNSELNDSTDDQSVCDQITDLWQLISDRRVAAMVIARGMPNAVWIGFLTYNSIIVVELINETPAQAGVLTALMSISYAVSSTQAGRITAMVESRFLPLMAMNTALAAGGVIVFLSESIWFAYVGVTTMGAGFGLVLSLYQSIITNMAPAVLRGGLVSVSEGMGRLTAAVTPIVMGAGISVATPWVGFGISIKLVGVVTAIVASSVSAACLIIVKITPALDTRGKH